MTTLVGNSKYVNPIGGKYVDPTTGREEVRALRASDGGSLAFHSSLGSAVPSDRECGATATRQIFTWTEGEGVLRVVVNVQGSSGTKVAVCFDAPDDATADSWLAGNAATSAPTMRRIVEAGVPREFIFSRPLRRMDLIDYSGTASAVFVEAGK